MIDELSDRGFRGDAEWVHTLEGHCGRPYWPGGRSGITLDPGVDLAYADESIVALVYEKLLRPEELQACLRARSATGHKARRRLAENERLRNIRLSRQEAETIFPMVAVPYWIAAKRRWPELESNQTPGAVHTVTLSLCYNRGPGNPALRALGEPLRARDWAALADVVADMQDEHRLSGIQQRRDEEAAYLRRHARRQKLQRLADAARGIEAADPEPLPEPSIDVPDTIHSPR